MVDLLHDEPVTRLPHNLEAERALLGTLIFDNRQIDLVQSILPGETMQRAMERGVVPERARRGQPQPEPLFYSPAHELIFGAICRLHVRGMAVDITTLGEELLNCGQLDSIGGAPYLGSLADEIFSLGQATQYAQIIEQKWRLRCLVRASQEIAEEALRSTDPTQDVIERAEQRIYEVARARATEDFVHIARPLMDELYEIEKLAKGDGEAPGVMTGFAKLDLMIGGMRPSNMIVLAARPGMGKTAFALNVGLNVAKREAKAVGVFSLEMSKSELSVRLMCSEAHVSMAKARSGKMRRDELEALHEAGERLANLPLHIDDTSGLTILELRARARRLKSRLPNLGLLIIDYLQLMNGGGKRYDNRQQEVSEISRSLKGLAKELAVPVMALSQLSRQSEQRRGAEKYPRLSDLRESGAIEQDADIVLFIHREQQSKPGEAPAAEAEEAKIIIGKNRHGATDKIDVLFRGEFTEFIDLAYNR